MQLSSQFILFDLTYSYDHAANKGQSTVNYCQALFFYLSSNDHCDRSLFQESLFLLILFLFLRNCFERS